MLTIKKKYIVDEQNHKVAVQLDIDTYEKIEEVLENYALSKFMEEDEDDELFGLEDAKKIYSELDKTP